MHDERITALLAEAARQNVTIYRDRLWHGGRAAPPICRALEANAAEINALLLRAGWFNCHCPRCVQ